MSDTEPKRAYRVKHIRRGEIIVSEYELESARLVDDPEYEVMEDLGPMAEASSALVNANSSIQTQRAKYEQAMKGANANAGAKQKPATPPGQANKPPA